jgi:hypothetical protein
MRWRDIRFEKPTEADGDDCGQVLQLLSDGSVGSYDYANDCDCIAWMPLSELPAFDRIPDPPEGWRFADKTKDVDDGRALVLSEDRKRWEPRTFRGCEWADLSIYIVPINPPKPPEPQYRPFANAAEFEPYRNKWWRHKTSNSKNPPLGYSDTHWGGMPFGLAFDKYEFEDGSPFGVKVEP